MASADVHGWSLRQEQAEVSRLARAFVVSVAVHLLVLGTYYTGQKMGVWRNFHVPAWLQPVQKLAEALKKKSPPPPPLQEAPLMLVEVTPEQATTEPPKDAKYYSSLNAKAANPEPDTSADVPKITGKQTQVVRTEDVSPQKFAPLQPSKPTAPAKEEEQPEQKAKPKPAVGDLALAKPEDKPEDKPRGDEGEAKQPKPRTVKEAMARQQNRRLVGEKMKQEGGVQRRGGISFDTRSTPYGEYDDALIQAIQDHWYSLLEQRDYASDSRGKVVLKFVLHYDGRVSDMAIAENTAGEVLGLICRKSVEDNSPFASWPSDMRRMLGDLRHIQFTFYYN